MGAAKKAKNKSEKLLGQVKEQFGKATGNQRLRNEGRGDQVKANLKTQGEKVKDTFWK